MPEWFTVTVRVSVMVSVNIGVFINSAQTLQIVLWWVSVMVRVRVTVGVSVKFMASFRVILALGYFIYPGSLDGATVDKVA